MSIFRLLPTILVKFILRGFYRLFCLRKIDPLKMTFASYRSDKIMDNLAFVNEYVEKNLPEYQRVLLFKRLEGGFIGKIRYFFHMIRSCYYLATSKYFFIDDFYFPIYVIKPRTGVEIIQLWHSAGAFKKFGHSTLGKPFGPSPAYLKHVKIHAHYTRAYVSSKEVIPYFAEAFQMRPELIFPYGTPRTDYFFRENEYQLIKTRFLNDYPQFQGKKIVLYAPTFRGKSHGQNQFKLPIDLNYLEDRLKEQYGLIVHLHPYMARVSSITNTEFVQYMNNTYSIQELLLLADILITDYSSIIFDYSLLERPMIFYAYDLEEYIRERNFYYNYESFIPGPIAQTTEELAKLIELGQYNLERVNQFKEMFFDYRDGKSTKRIVEHILQKEK